jgi:hypothetical protein
MTSGITNDLLRFLQLSQVASCFIKAGGLLGERLKAADETMRRPWRLSLLPPLAKGG